MADTPSRNLPPKREIALRLLEGDSVFIHLDPRKDGVVVPKNHARQPQLVLQIGLNLAIRIPDLEVDEEGVSCTLHFNRAPFWCRMPWSAVYALVGPDGRGMLWPEDVPPEVAAQMRAGRAGKAAPKKPRPKLAAVVEDGADAPAPSAAPSPREAPVEPAPPRRGTKRPAARPALAPVPSPAETRRDRPARPPLGAHHRPSSPDGSRPAAPTAPGGPPRAPAPPPPSKKPKRELPPYLRVVK
jgi:stringent starvation protein B